MKVPTIPLTVWKIPRESQEWIGPITVTASGIPVSNFKVCLIADETRPPSSPASNVWTTPILSGTDQGYSVSGLTPGTYHLYVLYSTGLEPGIVVEAGLVVVT